MPWDHQLLYEYHHAASRIARAFALSAFPPQVFYLAVRFSFCIRTSPPTTLRTAPAPSPNRENGRRVNP